MATNRGNTQSAYAQIRRAIVEGRYKPGQRLIEQRIAEEFELSRTPVRESLRRLEAEGLVVSIPNRGSVVRSVSIEEISDLYGLRARLEAYAAELAAERFEDEHLSRMDEGISRFGKALKSLRGADLAGLRVLNEANSQIHGAIMDAARNDRLAQLLARTVDVPLVFQAFRQFQGGQRARSHLFHQLIRDAISGRDGPRAAALMTEHVLQGRDVLLAHLNDNPDVVDDIFGDYTLGDS
ncbi:GntR family transcriptional regulator [Antricoccus suffuscus]|uniref:GntR family transcriptional regulator n=1 Tax=Antricoccus suffuscus TaxID=1629062 RepID=A0A2T0ZZM7_9ACTN|nr:GntR family transcriptional regulator [Antricoccus suffuscus]PRZ41802.1 GntR family transcriptional regulator [Antricoccus suffuscus]